MCLCIVLLVGLLEIQWFCKERKMTGFPVFIFYFFIWFIFILCLELWKKMGNGNMGEIMLNILLCGSFSNVQKDKFLLIYKKNFFFSFWFFLNKPHFCTCAHGYFFSAESIKAPPPPQMTPFQLILIKRQ